MKLFAVIAAAVLLTACATVPTKSSDATPIAPDRLVSTPTVSSKTPAKVVVIRDRGSLGSANTVHFKVDGRDVALLNQGEKAQFTVDPGEHTFSVTDWLNHHSETRAALTASEKTHYRVGYGDGGIMIQRWEELGD